MSEDKDCDCEKTIIHGDHDKYGLGSAISSICGTSGCLIVVICIALLCTGNFTAVVMALIGG
jgi:hypothetical protein